VEQYISEGYAWFVFDMVNVGPDPKTLEAVSYRFETDQLFYPLKISRTNHGHTDILLYVLATWGGMDAVITETYGVSSRRPSPVFEGIPLKDIQFTDVSRFRRESLEETVMPELGRLFAENMRVRLSLWRIQGDITQLDHDVKVSLVGGPGSAVPSGSSEQPGAAAPSGSGSAESSGSGADESSESGSDEPSGSGAVKQEKKPASHEQDAEGEKIEQELLNDIKTLEEILQDL
jgi:hypothetical protein